ncbi:MAG: NADH-quinone oxidoreductase subunit A [Cyclobacteriaceae bacterium]|nr:NADH-quinone oxidoreductase subunit A [Cyclobacteriaceae bacterium]
MNETASVGEFGIILIFLIGGLLFLLASFLVARLVRPSRPNDQKLETYESGEQALGTAWAQFNLRFYIVALMFILFEVEIVFLFPWSTVFANKELIRETNGTWGWFSLVEMILFIFILALGLAYAWIHGLLDWVNPVSKTTDISSPVPKDLYTKINEKYQ